MGSILPGESAGKVSRRNEEMSQPSDPGSLPITSVKASLHEVERRRSERLLITVPIRVEGVDRNGEKFSEETRTLIISRQGARIILKRMVSAGASVLITNLVVRRTGRFRIVGPTQPPSGDGGEWGVECQEANYDIWGIGFPPASLTAGACAALLECRRCHAVKLTPLSLVEYEVLGASGLLAKECEPCARLTSWSCKETSTSLPGEEGCTPVDTPGAHTEHRPGKDVRAHNRVVLQLPMRVRSFYGTEEITRSENVSRGGICFITDRSYEVGEIILITCPYESGGHNVEIRGKVVRRREMQGTGRKIYGICYER